MREIVDGIVHWKAYHPHIHSDVHSYLLTGHGIVIDPVLPPDGGVEAIARWCEPTQVVLTNRHHHRDASAVAERFGIPVRVSAPGVEEAAKHVAVQPFAWGEELAPGVRALEVGAICPDESAIHLADGDGALACADGVIRIDGGPLTFVPDFLLGDDPETVKSELRAAYRPLLNLKFAHLLLAHGEPVVGDGHEQLARFVQ